MDLTVDGFAATVGTEGPVSITGLGTRGGPVPTTRDGMLSAFGPGHLVEIATNFTKYLTGSLNVLYGRLGRLNRGEYVQETNERIDR